MKWILFTLLSYSAAVQAQSLTDYQCHNGARTSEAVLDSACYPDVTAKVVTVAEKLSQGRRVKPCFAVTSVGQVDASAEKNMKNLYGNFPVEFIDFYVSTTHYHETREKYEPEHTSFVVKVRSAVVRSLNGVTFCRVHDKAEIVNRKTSFETVKPVPPAQPAKPSEKQLEQPRPFA